MIESKERHAPRRGLMANRRPLGANPLLRRLGSRAATASLVLYFAPDLLG